MNIRREAQKDNDGVLWGGPLWRRILIAALAFAVLGGWLLFAERLFG